MATKTETKIPVKEEMVNVFVPKMSGEDQTFFVGLNGKNYIFPRGKTVAVPKAVADIVDMHNRAIEARDNYREERQKLMNQVQGAPV